MHVKCSLSVRLRIKPAAALSCLDRFRLYDNLYHRLQRNLNGLFVSAVSSVEADGNCAVRVYENVSCHQVDCKRNQDLNKRAKALGSLVLNWSSSAPVGNIGPDCQLYMIMHIMSLKEKMVKRSLFSRTFPSLITIHHNISAFLLVSEELQYLLYRMKLKLLIVFIILRPPSAVGNHVQLPEPQTSQWPRPHRHAAISPVAGQSTWSQPATHEGRPGPVAH